MVDFNAIVNNFAAVQAKVAPSARRYTLHSLKDGYLYGDWHIAPASWLRPSPAFDWDWWHDDYDGAEDAYDNRCGSAASLEACIAEIHEWEDDQ